MDAAADASAKATETRSAETPDSVWLDVNRPETRTPAQLREVGSPAQWARRRHRAGRLWNTAPVNSPEEPQTPPARILIPLGIVTALVAVLVATMVDLGVVGTVMTWIVALMGIGILIQGVVNLKRERQT
ncbi:hypothetical protein [Prescottella agglutinans]|uniref:hypothetical protein n=1 Tax=Prescottella agglutinans TaxID=1644129 RepID=UPI003D978DF7